MNLNLLKVLLVLAILGSSLCGEEEDQFPIAAANNVLNAKNLFNDMNTLRGIAYNQKNDFLNYVQKYQEGLKTSRNYSWGDSYAQVRAWINMYADSFKAGGALASMNLIPHEGLTVSAYEHALYLQNEFKDGVIAPGKAHIQGESGCDQSPDKNVRFWAGTCKYSVLNRMFAYNSRPMGACSFSAAENVFGTPDYLQTARDVNLFFMIDDRVPSRGHLKSFLNTDKLLVGIGIVQAGTRKIVVVNYGKLACTEALSLAPRADKVTNKYTNAEMRSKMCWDRATNKFGC